MPAPVRIDPDRTSRLPSGISRATVNRENRPPPDAPAKPPTSNETVPARLPSSASDA